MYLTSIWIYGCTVFPWLPISTELHGYNISNQKDRCMTLYLLLVQVSKCVSKLNIIRYSVWCTNAFYGIVMLPWQHCNYYEKHSMAVILMYTLKHNCVHAHMNAHAHVHTHTHTHTHTQTNKHTDMHMHIYTCMYVCIHTQILRIALDGMIQVPRVSMHNVKNIMIQWCITT